MNSNDTAQLADPEYLDEVKAQAFRFAELRAWVDLYLSDLASKDQLAVALFNSGRKS